jgi:hypothetical protein
VRFHQFHSDAGVDADDGGVAEQLGGQPVFVGGRVDDLDPDEIVGEA